LGIARRLLLPAYLILPLIAAVALALVLSEVDTASAVAAMPLSAPALAPQVAAVRPGDACTSCGCR
jgi:hypothetical protein